MRFATLAAAIRATFERRATAVPSEHPPSLTDAFTGDSRKVEQWRSFLAREPLLIDEPDLPTVVREIGDFIMPAAHAAINDRRMPGRRPEAGDMTEPVGTPSPSATESQKLTE